MFAIFITLVWLGALWMFHFIRIGGLKEFFILLEILFLFIASSVYNFVVMAGVVLFFMAIFH